MSLPSRARDGTCHRQAVPAPELVSAEPCQGQNLSPPSRARAEACHCRAGSRPELVTTDPCQDRNFAPPIVFKEKKMPSSTPLPASTMLLLLQTSEECSLVKCMFSMGLFPEAFFGSKSYPLFFKISASKCISDPPEAAKRWPKARPKLTQPNPSGAQAVQCTAGLPNQTARSNRLSASRIVC